MLLEPQLSVKESKIELKLLLESHREFGFGVGIGLIGFPPAFSYQQRYGETESRSSTLTVYVEGINFPYQIRKNEPENEKDINRNLDTN